MRTTTALMIAAAIIAPPALAQDNVTAGNSSAADAGALANTDAALGAEAPTNGLTTGPGAAPAVTDTAMMPDDAAAPAEDDDDDGRFPWGLLGLLGLAGLLGRRRREDAVTTR